jgi:hypothetical protein
MTPKIAPRAATWFLNRFGSNTEDESVMGDLSEQYQRGRGALWYWRQVLSIVFVGLSQEAHRNKRNFLVALFHTWCVWGGLQISAGVVLLVRFVLLHPEQLQNGISVYGLPILALRTGTGAPYAEQVEIMLLSVLLNALTLFATGIYCSRSSKTNPRSVLLAFVTSYAVVNFGLTITIMLHVARHVPNDAAFLLIRALIALPFAPALILIGGMRGLSPHFKR